MIHDGTVFFKWTSLEQLGHQGVETRLLLHFSHFFDLGLHFPGESCICEVYEHVEPALHIILPSMFSSIMRRYRCITWSSPIRSLSSRLQHHILIVHISPTQSEIQNEHFSELPALCSSQTEVARFDVTMQESAPVEFFQSFQALN